MTTLSIEPMQDLTLIDLFHLPHLRHLWNMDSNIITKYSNVARWWNDISARPSWNAVVNGITSTAV